jgi:Type II secretion system (T2SS), protein M
MSRIQALVDRLSDRDRRALLMGVAVIVPVLLWVGAVRPWRNALLDVRERVASERSLLAREQALVANTDDMPDQLRAAAAGTERALRRLVDAPNLTAAEAEVTDYIEASASKSRVLLEEIRGVVPGRRESHPAGIQPIRLAVSGESDLNGVANLLRRVEEGTMLLRVNELSIEPKVERSASAGSRSNTTASRSTPTGYISFTMIIEAYTPLDETTAETAVKEPAP